VRKRIRSIIRSIIVYRLPIRSLLLIGSHARGDADAHADYDLIAIIDTPLLPIYALKLERLSLQLSAKFSVKIGIRPMATLKLRRAKGNLFMMKVKREALVLAGEDLISSIDVGRPTDISPEYYFSFLASLMKELIQAYGPGGSVNVDRVGVKIYRSLVELAALSTPCISSMIRSTLNGFGCTSGINGWFKLRDLLITLFLMFAKALLGIEGSVIDVTRDFLRTNKGISPLKNLESCIALMLLKREIPTPRWIFSRILVKDRLRAALLLLLASVDKKSVRDSLINEAYRILKPCFKIRPHGDNMKAMWYALRKTILTYWDYIHTVMGLFD